MPPSRARELSDRDGVLTQKNLEALYGAPIRTLTDGATGESAFLPG
jgi:hypothetical protein